MIWWFFNQLFILSFFVFHSFQQFWLFIHIIPPLSIINDSSSMNHSFLFHDFHNSKYCTYFHCRCFIFCYQTLTLSVRFFQKCSQELLRCLSMAFKPSSLLYSLFSCCSHISHCASVPTYQLMRFFASALPEHIMVSMPALSPVVTFLLFSLCRLWHKEVFLLGVLRKEMLFNQVTFLLKSFVCFLFYCVDFYW